MKYQTSVLQMSWFLDLKRTNQLDLDPPYQRKSVWTPKDRRYFLDTIFRNYPCPPLFLHKTTDDKGFTVYHVVDGKQRLETVLDFSKDKFSIDETYGDIAFNGKKFSELTKEQKRVFWDYIFPIIYLDISDGEEVNNIFDRVNRNAKNLKPQELRHARFTGWFISFVEKEAEKEFWEKVKISTKARIKRMDNIQFISELLLIILENEIVGFNQYYLDEKTAKYDDIDEAESVIDEDEFRSKLQNIKDYILSMENTNNCITTYTTGHAAFHSLWALLSLNYNLLPDGEPPISGLF